MRFSSGRIALGTDCRVRWALERVGGKRGRRQALKESERRQMDPVGTSLKLI